MAAPSLKYAALATLNLWLLTDSSVHKELNDGTDREKLAAIARGANRWGFEHELQSIHDEGAGLVRFQPALDLIDGLRLQDFEDEPTTTIAKTARLLSLRYGNGNVVSATTKLLWMKFRSPIIIYDSKAGLALGANLLRKFYDQWHARYAVHRAEILDSCNALQDVLDYVSDPGIASADFVRDLAAENWFQQRVFGNYLTNIGRSAR